MIHYIYWTNLSTNLKISSYYFREEMQKSTLPDYQWCKGLMGLSQSKGYNVRQIVTDMIKESDEDSFVFILTKNQWPEFSKWVTEEELKDLIIFKTEGGVTNGNHPQDKRNLNLVVFAGKNHPMWDMFTTEEETESV